VAHTPEKKIQRNIKEREGRERGKKSAMLNAGRKDILEFLRKYLKNTKKKKKNIAY
jgi:septum formation topological specificity factor MinE